MSMRRHVLKTLSVCACAAMLSLTACQSSNEQNDASAQPQAAGSIDQVIVTGAAGAKPTLQIPDTPPPTALETKVITPGKGAAIKSGQNITVNYLGQTWAKKGGQPNVFDNSYDRKEPFPVAIGTGQVIPTWDEGLIGQKVGSRVLLVGPPKKSYGTMPGHELEKETLVFVVDILTAK